MLPGDKLLPAANKFVVLKNTGLTVPQSFFEPPWTAADWYEFALALLQLLPAGSAFAFTQARRHRGPQFARLYRAVGAYSCCPPAVQTALFFERRDVQHLVERSVASLHALLLPEQVTALVAGLLVPWRLPLGTALATAVCEVAAAAEIVAIPGSVIQFWQSEGVTVLPSEQYVIFTLLLFAEPWAYINRRPPPGDSALHFALNQVWTLAAQHTPTTATKSPPRSLTR